MPGTAFGRELTEGLDMALPSQNNESRSGVMHQTGAGMSSTGKVAVIVLGLVLAAGGIYALTKFMPKTDGTGGDKVAVKPEDGKPAEVKPGEQTPVTIQRSDIPNPNAIPARGADGVAIPPSGTPGALLPGTGTPGATPTTPGANGTSPGTTPGTNPGATPGAATPGTTPNTFAPVSGWMGNLTAGDTAYAGNKLVDARREYSKVILSPDAPKEQKDALRSKLQQINETLVFSPTIDPTDTLVESYKVQSGDALAKIPRRRELATDYRLIQRINRISRPEALRVGQTLKLVRGPFHAVVNKADFRVDIYAGSPDRPADWLYIKSYRCGLGDPTQGSSTPVGNYVVKKGSKLVNPHWTNPRTGEKFDKDNPQNPIGEFWLGWQGVGESAANTGFGFHGTIDPDSIGQQKSMGCVRFGAEDIAQIYELLVEEVSVVRVLP